MITHKVDFIRVNDAEAILRESGNGTELYPKRFPRFTKQRRKQRDLWFYKTGGMSF